MGLFCESGGHKRGNGPSPARPEGAGRAARIEWVEREGAGALGHAADKLRSPPGAVAAI